MQSSTISSRLVRRSIAALAITLVATLSASAQTPVTWNLKKGDKLNYQFIQKNDIKVTVNGQEIKNVTTLDVDLAWTVEDVKDDVATVTQVISQAKVDLTTPMGPVSYDSKKKSEDATSLQIAKIYDNVVGEKYTLKLKKTGEITEVIVPEKVEKAVKGSPFEGLADSGSLLSSKGIQKMMAQVLPTLSPKPVKAGDKWNSSLDLPAGPIKMVLDSTYTLTSLDGAKAVIDGKIDTKITATEGAPLQVKVNKQSGDSKFSLDGGKLATSKINQAFDMTLTVNGMEISQTIAIDASMNLKK